MGNKNLQSTPPNQRPDLRFIRCGRRWTHVVNFTEDSPLFYKKVAHPIEKDGLLVSGIGRFHFVRIQPRMS